MRALCPACGFHHEVVRVLEDGFGENRKDVYEVAPLDTCTRTWLSEGELMEARARYGAEAIVTEEDDA
jgi:hypothetical protein